MKSILYVIGLITVLFFIHPAIAQIVPDDRSTVWNPGLNSAGGIPQRSTIYTIIAPSGDDDRQIIQTALNACPEGQVVLLGPGIFNIDNEGLDINRSNITLRGSGPDKTFLVKPIGTQFPVINIGTRWVKFLEHIFLDSDASKGSYQIILASNPGYEKGELVAINQRPDPDFVDWGCHAIEGEGSMCWFGDCDPADDPTGRPLGQILEIDDVSGNTLTFTTPLHTDYKVNLGARLAKMGDGDNVIPAVKYSGVEDLYVANGEGGDGGGNISVFGAGYCWIKNVESEKSNGSNINMVSSLRCVLRDSYIHSTVNPTPGGAGYGINLGVYSSDNLVENNISWNFNKIMLMRASGGGNVIAYNYMDDGWGDYYPTQAEAGLNASHYATSHHELFEGNESYSFTAESYWGNSSYITIFRNHLTGLRGAHGFDDYKYLINEGTPNESYLYYEDIQTRKAVGISAGSYYYTFVGNVLGFEGMSIIPKRSEGIGQESLGFIYQIINPGGFGDGDYVPMWRLDLGMDELTCEENDQNVKDIKVLSTLIRDGNYDYASDSIKWDRAEQTIPKSLYLGNNKPLFFGTTTWPLITPENTSNPIQGVLPAKARFDSIFYGAETAPVIVTISDGFHCDIGKVTLEATANKGTINWYSSLTGGTYLGTGNSFTTPDITSTKIYYVDATDNDKTTTIRTAIAAIIGNVPNVTSTSNASRCGNGSVTLGATTDDEQIRWYSSPAGGEVLEYGNSFTTPVLNATTTYYVEAVNYYCTSGTRTAVTATIDNTCTSVVSSLATDNSIKVFPNPTKGKIEIFFDEIGSNEIKIELYNCLGNFIQAQIVPVDENRFEVDLLKYPAGLYLVKLKTQDKILFERILKTEN